MHGSNRLGGNSLSDLLVFGRRAGLNAAYLAKRLRSRPAVADADVRAGAEAALAPFAEAAEGAGEAENAYALQHELQESMQDLVGIIRTDEELSASLKRLDELEHRARHVAVEGHRQYNPGWHLALDLANMLLVSRCIAIAARERTESRGGHTREDFPATDDTWGGLNLVLRTDDAGTVTLARQPLPQMPDDLRSLFEQS